MKALDEVSAKIRARENELYLDSLNELENFFKAAEPDTGRAKMALKTADLLARKEGSRLHREVLEFSMLQTLHTSGESLAQAVGQRRPDLALLPEGTRP